MGHRLQRQECVCVSNVQRPGGGRVCSDARDLGEGNKISDKKQKEQRGIRDVPGRLIHHSDMKEICSIIFFIAFHFNVHVVLSCLQASDYPERKHNEKQEN